MERLAEGSVEAVLYYTAQALYSASLSNSPACRELGDWMRRPHPGDVVVETTTAFRVPPRADAIGRLVSIEWERRAFEDEPDQSYWECVTTVSSLADPAKLTRWTNSQFVRVPGYYLSNVLRDPPPHEPCTYCTDNRRPTEPA